LAYLLRQQREAGTWNPETGNTPMVSEGLTALCTFALLRSGVSADDAALKRALALIRSHKDEYTYTVSLDVLALCAANRLSDLELIRAKVAWLEAAQVKAGENRGSWSYTNTEAGRGDGSNTRFAVLALEAADKAGVKASADTWKRIAWYWAAHQNAEGGWGYMPKANTTPNMTYAGIASLSIASAIATDDQDKNAEAVRHGLAWLARHAVTGDDVLKKSFGFYSLHALEQAARTTHTKKIGDVDWREDLQRALLKAQDPATGAWKGGTEDALVSTCFALLFLAKDD
jgi:prenyltransferase beta subunit